MPMPNPFTGDAFSFATLTGSVARDPYIPQEIGSNLPWNSQGIATTVAMIEEKLGKIDIVEARPRGSVPDEVEEADPVIRSLAVPHYPYKVTVKADEVQNVRMFGSENAFEPFEAKRDEKLNLANRNMDVTLEFARAGAIGGVIRNRNGATIYDLHAEFGVQRNTHDINFNNAGTKVLSELVEAKAKAQEELGGLMVDGFYLFAGGSIWKKYIDHPTVSAAWDRWQDGAFHRQDKRKGFEIVEGVFLIDYRKGKVGNTTFIGDDESFLCPNAVGLYETRFAPANTMETANTIGLPKYAIPHPMPFNGGVDILVQSNHVSWVNIPRSIVRIKQS